MANPDLEPGALAKPAKGSYTLKRDKDRNEADDALAAAAKAAKARDGNRCRWPERHKCRGGLEAAHLKDKSLGGTDTTDNLITLCAWIHRSGAESIHSKNLRIDALTDNGANGICAFYRSAWSESRNSEWVFRELQWHSIGRERAIGLLERRQPERPA